MRTDVKVGIVLSLVVVVIAGWYYLGSAPEDQAVPLADRPAASPAAPAATPQPQPTVVRREEPARSSPRPTPAATVKPEPTPPAMAAGPDPTATPPMFEGLLGGAEHDDVGPPADSMAVADLLASGRDEPVPDPQSARGPLAANLTDTPAEPAAGGSPAPGRPTAAGDPRPTRRPRPESTARATPAPASPRPGTRTHTVGGGDTLAILAEVYYGSQRYTGLLQQANPHVDPLRLPVGAVLQIPPLNDAAATGPASPRAASPEPAVGTYIVKPGDSFYVIARDLLGNAGRWKELLELNSDLVDGEPKNLRPGQVLRLPGGSTTASR